MQPFPFTLQLGVKEGKTRVIGLNVTGQFKCRDGLVRAFGKQGRLSAFDNAVRYRADPGASLCVARFQAECCPEVFKGIVPGRLDVLLALHGLGGQR